MSTMTTANHDALKLIHIDASPAQVWRALTDARSVVSWMSAEALSMETSWQVGSPIVFRGVLHGRLRFENTGTVQAFEPERLLRYTHWSSLSRRALDDVPRNHVTLTFSLSPDGNGTRLQLLLGNMHDTAVRGHMDFHWDMTLPVLKRYCEATRVRGA